MFKSGAGPWPFHCFEKIETEFDTGWIGPPDWPEPLAPTKPVVFLDWAARSFITGPGLYMCVGGEQAKIHRKGINGGWYGDMGCFRGLTWNDDGTCRHSVEGANIVRRLSDG